MLCISAVYDSMRCPSVCLSRSWVAPKRIKISSKFFHHRVAKTFWFFHTKRGLAIPTETPLTGASNARGYETMTIFDQYLALSQKRFSQMGTCSETICKHRILFPSIQHLAWFPQGRPQGKPKCGKIAIFGLTHWLKHRITQKLLKIDTYMLRGVWQALNCLSIHGTHWVIVAGASPGETKMWAAVGENGEFLHLRFE